MKTVTTNLAPVAAPRDFDQWMKQQGPKNRPDPAPTPAPAPVRPGDGRLTGPEKAKVLRDFKEWSGGYYPTATPEEECKKYIDYGSPADIDKDAIRDFFEELEETDDIDGSRQAEYKRLLGNDFDEDKDSY